ncbi:polysaccharide export protein [bacterium]|nr:polysaccharide export protein [bacterium]MBU1881352.1 polysaccharide export protein [bacterium]
MKSSTWMFSILLVLLCVLQPASAEEDPTYRIKAGDLLDVYVHENPDLSLQVAVLPDGTISYPLVGNLYVQGLTTSGLQDILKTKFLDYLQTPVVVVSINSQASYKVYVMGEVSQPGALEYQEDLRLTDYIALAGGMTNNADLEECYIYSVAEDSTHRIVNLKEIFEENKQEMNITLKPDDTIVLDRKSGFFVGTWIEVAQILSILVSSATMYIIITRER